MSDTDSETKGRFRVYSFDPESEMDSCLPMPESVEKKIKSAVVLPIVWSNEIITKEVQKLAIRNRVIRSKGNL